MTRTELEKRLAQLGVRADAYSIGDDSANESYVVSFNGKKWRVYYSERGQLTNVRYFDLESEAYQYLLMLLTNDSSTRI